jgi:hypothetical protein
MSDYAGLDGDQMSLFPKGHRQNIPFGDTVMVWKGKA